MPTWLVKLDVRKAFDSVWQESMGDMVAQRIGGLRPGGGGTAGGMPWEARLGLLEAREMQVAVGDMVTTIPQSNGVRQGSPDSPILFSRIVGDCLEQALQETQHLLPPAKGPAPPESGGAFMDDAHLWSHDATHLQATLAALERRLAQHGLLINPGKTAVIYSQPSGGGTFRIGGGGGMQTLWGSYHRTRVTHHLWGKCGCDHRRKESPSTQSISQTCSSALCGHAIEGAPHTAPNPGTGGGTLGGASLAGYRRHSQGCQHHTVAADPAHDAPSAPSGGAVGGLGCKHPLGMLAGLLLLRCQAAGGSVVVEAGSTSWLPLLQDSAVVPLVASLLSLPIPG